MIHPVIRRATIWAVCVLAVSWAWVALRGPQGIPALLEKRHEIRELEERNANLKRDIENKKKLIHDLQYSREKQDEVIRQWLHQGKPNEIQFILPDRGAAKPDTGPHSEPAPRTR